MNLVDDLSELFVNYYVQTSASDVPVSTETETYVTRTANNCVFGGVGRAELEEMEKRILAEITKQLEITNKHIGNLTELTVATHVSKKRGDDFVRPFNVVDFVRPFNVVDFVRPFNVVDFVGLIRLAFPKQTVEQSGIGHVTTTRNAKTLLDYVFSKRLYVKSIQSLLKFTASVLEKEKIPNQDINSDNVLLENLYSEKNIDRKHTQLMKAVIDRISKHKEAIISKRHRSGLAINNNCNRIGNCVQILRKFLDKLEYKLDSSSTSNPNREVDDFYSENGSLLLFAQTLMPDNDIKNFITTSIQIDCGGSFTDVDGVLVFEIGEIKSSSKGIPKVRLQLELILKLIHSARCVVDKKSTKQIVLRGVIYYLSGNCKINEEVYIVNTDSDVVAPDTK